MFLINLCGKCYLIARLVGGTHLAHGRLVHSITLLKSAHAEGIPSVIHFFFLEEMQFAKIVREKSH